MAIQASAGLPARDEVHVEPVRGAQGELGPTAGSEQHVDRVLAELAEGQYGVVSRQQLLAAGLGRRAVGDRLRRGALHLIHRGVYAVGHPLVHVRGKWMAAVLAMGPHAVISHRTAAELWGIGSRSSRAIEVTRPSHARHRSRILAHRSLLPDDERTAVDGIPVTTVPRTILDLASVVSKRQLERALNEVEVQGLTDALSFPDLLARYPRRRGSSVLRALLQDDDMVRGRIRSPLEERFAAFIDTHGLPRPRFNADLAVGGRFLVVDCLWGDERLIVELDGRAVHGTRRAFEADRERDRLLLIGGWRVMHVTWRQLRDEAPAIATDLRNALRGERSSR